jgi:hypothetical protein
MPAFKVTGPDGKSFKVTANSIEEAGSAVDEMYASRQPQTLDVPPDEGDYRSRFDASSRRNLQARPGDAGAPGISALNTHGASPGIRRPGGDLGAGAAMANSASQIVGSAANFGLGVTKLVSALTGSDAGVGKVSRAQKDLSGMQDEYYRKKREDLLNDPAFQDLARKEPGRAQSMLNDLLPGKNPIQNVANFVAQEAPKAMIGGKVAGPLYRGIKSFTPFNNAIGNALARAGLTTTAGGIAGGVNDLVTPTDATTVAEMASDKASSVPVSMMIGGAMPAVAGVANVGINAGRAIARPFRAMTEGGAQREAGSIVSKSLGKTLPENTTPILAVKQSPVQGYNETLVEATQDPNIAAIQKQFTRELDPTNQQNIAALHVNLKRMGASDEEIAQMFKERSLMDKGNYDSAFGSEEKYRQNAADSASLRAQADSLTQQAGKDYTIATQSQKLADLGRRPAGTVSGVRGENISGSFASLKPNRKPYEWQAFKGRPIGGEIISPDMKKQASTFKSATEEVQSKAVELRQKAMQLERENELSGLSGTSADTVSPGMQQLLSDPQMSRVVKAAQQDMHSLGIPGDITSMRGMHFMKIALDDMKQAGYSPTGSSMDAINGKVLQSFSDKLNADLNANDLYKTARNASAAAAKKIDAALVSNRIIQKAGNAPISPATRQPNEFSDSGLRGSIADERALIKKATGYGGPSSLADILDADPNIPRNQILQDTIAQSARAEEAKRLMGLNGRTDTSAIPNLEQGASHMFLPSMVRIPLKLADFLGSKANERIDSELLNMLRDREIASEYMKKANTLTKAKKLQQFLRENGATTLPVIGSDLEQNKRN